MSQARIYTVKSARKDQGTCPICGDALTVGTPYRHFTVGFRSRAKKVRCMKPSCTPTRSQLESSRLAEIYEVIDIANFDGCENEEDIRSVLEEVASAARDLSSEYAEASVNQNTGAVFNQEAADRGERLEAYADELDSWDPGDEEPEEPENDGSTGAYEAWQENHDMWLQAAKDSAQEKLDEEDF